MAESHPVAVLAPEQWAVISDVAGIVQAGAWGAGALALLLASTLGAVLVRVLWVR